MNRRQVRDNSTHARIGEQRHDETVLEPGTGIAVEGDASTQRVDAEIDQIVSDMMADAPDTQTQRVRVTPEQLNNRVVITGMGVVSSVGVGVDEFWGALTSGTSGITTITLCDVTGYPTRIAGEVKGWDPAQHLDRKAAQRMSRAGQFAVTAALQAVKDANLRLGEDNHDAGVVLGTGTSSFPDTEAAMRTLMERGPMRISPFFAPIALPNMPAGQVAMHLKLGGHNNTVVTACAAGNQAIGEAYEVIRRGDAEVMLAGGTEAPICQLGLAAFCVMRALSTRNDEPTQASRPYDKERDGFVPAEGSAILVLESLNHALEREATIYAEVVGYGASSDAYHSVMPQPQGAGLVRAMQRALRTAGIQPLEVDYVNAHATSTQLGDVAETEAIKHVFGEYAEQLPVSSTKSMTGHLLGAANAVEAVASVMAIHTDIIPPTINYENPDPACDLDCVPNEARKADVRVAMSNGSGFGGQNAVLLFREYQG